MSFWKRLFGEAGNLEVPLEQRIGELEQHFAEKRIAEMFAEMAEVAGMTASSLDDAKSTARVIIERVKADAKETGEDRLPRNYGDFLLECEKTDPEIVRFLSTKRREGVRDEDIRWFWNMTYLERGAIEKIYQMILWSTFNSARSSGRTAEEAATHARKYHFYPGDPNDTRVTSMDDRPLPTELTRRENVWLERESRDDPVAFKNRLEGFSSYNALIRAEIRAGRF